MPLPFLRLLTVVSEVALLVGLNRGKADEQSTLADTPIVVVQSNSLSQPAFFRYARELSEQLSIGSAVLKQIDSEDLRDMMPDLENPRTGMLVFLNKGLVPGAEQFSFQQVNGEADFRRMVQARKGAWGGDNGEVIDKGDGKYVITMTNSWREPLPDDYEEPVPEAAGDSVTVAVGVGGGGVSAEVSSGEDDNPFRSNSKVIEEDGKKYREHSYSFTNYMRYVDGYSFESQSRELLNVNLSSPETYMAGGKQSLDGEVRFYPERIPIGWKHLGWNMLNSGASVQLQQFDGEDDVQYQARRSGGEFGLRLLRAAMFDMDFVHGRLKLIEDNRPMNGSLLLRTRAGSQTAEDFAAFAAARSRFAPLLQDDQTVAVLHVAVSLPDDGREALQAAGKFLGTSVADNFSLNTDALMAGSDLIETISGVAEHGNIEVFLRVRKTPEAGAVISGGIQAADSPHLLKGLFALMNSVGDPTYAEEHFSLIEREGNALIEVRFDAEEYEWQGSPYTPTHGFIMHDGPRLWVAFGGENAWRDLVEGSETCESAVRRTRTRMLTARVDFEKWLEWSSDDDPTGLSALPRTLEGLMIGEMNFSAPGVERFALQGGDDLLDRVRAMGGSLTGSLSLDADTEGFLVQADMGAALARYWVARWIWTIDQAMGNIEQLQEAEEEVAEATELPQATSGSDGN